MSQANPFRGHAVILGAGASKGASVGGISPPLDAEFLDTAHRLRSRRGRSDDAGRTWREFVKRLRLAGLDEKKVRHWRLEQLSTYLEARANMPSLQHSVGRPADYSMALQALNQVICWTLARANGARGCVLHRQLFSLVRPSCVVTFNYDLVADESLLALQQLCWQRASYAGNSLVIRGANGKYKRPRPRVPRGSSAPLLLKLHGSINWAAHKRAGGFSLVADRLPGDSLAHSAPPEHPLVVPPVAAKMDIRRGALRSIWKEAAKNLRTAPGWIIWGYSFPQTDTVTHVLCRTALARNRKPKPIVVINPDYSVSDRVSDALEKVRIRRWGSIERFLLDHGALTGEGDGREP